MSQEINLGDSILEESLQKNIEQCFCILQYMRCTINWEMTDYTNKADGITIMKGWYKILDIKRDVIFSSDFQCAADTYIFFGRNMDIELCFRSSVAKVVSGLFGAG